MCTYYLVYCKICTFAENILQYAFYICSMQMHKILSLVFIVLHWYTPELIVSNYVPIVFPLIFLGGGLYFMCFINLPLRGVMWNMQGAEQNYFTPGLFACSQWKVLKCISYVCFACCLSMFSIPNRLRTNKQFFFKVDNRELLKFTDKSQFWLMLSTNNRYCTWSLTLMSLSILIVICKLFVEMKDVLGLKLQRRMKHFVIGSLFPKVCMFQVNWQDGSK
jgi:hypothetical protein